MFTHFARRKLSTFSTLFTFGVLSLTVAGCGGGGADLPDLGTVSGKVTMDGQPLAGAVVIFTPVSGPGSSTGVADEAGEYKLVFRQAIGAVVGSHKVSISKRKAEDLSLHDQQAGTGPDAPAAAAPVAGGHGQNAGDAGATRDPAETIAAKYNDATELTADVKSGDNSIDFALTSS
jgi:hypothetical protein